MSRSSIPFASSLTPTRSDVPLMCAIVQDSYGAKHHPRAKIVIAVRGSHDGPQPSTTETEGGHAVPLCRKPLPLRATTLTS